MIFVEPSCEIIKDSHTIESALENIEQAARVCYASIKKSYNLEDNKKFLFNLFQKRHYRPFEFGTIYYTIPLKNIFLSPNYSEEQYIKNKISSSPWTKEVEVEGPVYCTTNCRVILETIVEIYKDLTKEELFDKFWTLIHSIYEYYPDYHKDRTTILWKISRGVADEFRTHTQISSLMQSTRYCNYSSDKFDNRIRICRPQWMNKSTNQLNDMISNNEDFSDPIYNLFLASWGMSEAVYNELIKDYGVPAEQARGVLPFDLYTEFIQCGFDEDWENFFNQRYFGTTGKPHPDAKYIASQAYYKWKGVTE